MPYYFFFSYARNNNDDYLRKFFDDLSDKIREILGFGPGVQVGFFDQKDVELGAEWDPKLAQALQTCPVMVSLYSQAYFNSPYCGKEWECFRKRRALYPEAKQLATPTVELPSVIKPVIWAPLWPGQDPPEAVSGAQYTMGDPHAVHNVEGLKKMRKQYGNYEALYDSFIEQLAKQTLEALEKYSLPTGADLKDWLEMDPPKKDALPPLDPFPVLKDVESAFHPALRKGVAPPPAPTGRRKGPKFVRFVFIAGEPNQFPVGARTLEFYLQDGRGEWKPYYPEAPRPIELLAESAANNLDMYSDELTFDGDLAKAVRAAEVDRSLVVLFVDSWTAELPYYQPILKDLDQYAYINCSIFVPWNENDPETAGRSEVLRQLVRRDIFPRWSRLADTNQSFFFRDSIQSIDELRDQLRDTLRQLQTLVSKDVIEHATKETIPRRIDSDIAKPSLSHRPTSEGVAS